MRTPFHRTALGLLAGLTLAFVAVVSPASAQVPDPIMSTFLMTPAACGPGLTYVFTPVSGTFTVSGTLRDAASVPVPNYPLTVNVRALSGTLAPCGTGSHLKPTVSGPNGNFSVTFNWRDMAGYGRFNVNVMINGVAFGTFPGNRSTCPDLDASGWVDIIDIGILAAGLPPLPGMPPAWYIDYDCSGLWEVLDLGIWATGLGIIC